MSSDSLDAFKDAYIFKVFGDQLTFVCKEYNNFQGSKSKFMVSDFNIFPIMLLSMEWILVYCRFNNYFTFITKGKLHFSLTLIYSFYCCLVKESRALSVVKQFANWELVAYKPIAYKSRISVINVGTTTNYKLLLWLTLIKRHICIFCQ